MTTVMRIAVLLVAVLLLAHGQMAAGKRPQMPTRSVAELERVLSHDPILAHAAHGGRQCRETGCMVAASQGAWAVMQMILPDLPQARPFMAACCFGPPVEQHFAVLFTAPPVPPPKSHILEVTGVLFA